MLDLRPRVISPLFLVLVVIPALLAKTLEAPVAPVQELQDVAREFQRHLDISQIVQVVVVPHDPHLASSRKTDYGFVISFDKTFLTTLDLDETRAVLAHEMGHVWISTHHPFLQTEELANRQAVKLVPSESLNSVYKKVGGHGSSRPASVLGTPLGGKISP